MATNDHRIMLSRRAITSVPLIGLILWTCGIGETTRGAEATQNRQPPEGVRHLEAPGIHNLYALGTNVYSGSAPEGEEAFAALQKLGVKTIITVDGAKPEIELARKYGMRYVHLPHGYSGISTNLQLRLAKAVESLPGPIYVHCHHGKHRGPTAAAILCMAREGWSPDKAESWLLTAGTSSAYEGLYQTVRTYQRPTAEQLQAVPSDFPETARVSGLVEAMVDIDERWEHLRQVREEGYRPPRDHPDIKPANEAVILWEQYREAQRLPDSQRLGAEFIASLKAAEEQAREAERLLRLFDNDSSPTVRAQLDATFDAMGKTCSACHKTYRDRAETK